jgi:hypothetical protein
MHNKILFIFRSIKHRTYFYAQDVEKFVKKYRGQSEWKDQLTIRMDFPVRGIVTILRISYGVMYTHTQYCIPNLFLL